MDPRARTRRGSATALFVLCAAFIGLGSLLALSRTEGRAYQLHGFRWDHATVGYSVADTAAEGYATEALRLWSQVGPLRFAAGGNDIQIVIGPLLPPIQYEGQPAQANVEHTGDRITRCEVRLDPAYYFALNEVTRQAVLTHELGHCLGLDHSRVPSIMQSPFLYAFSPDDAAALRALYGASQPLLLGTRINVPGIAAD